MESHCVNWGGGGGVKSFSGKRTYRTVNAHLKTRPGINTEQIWPNLTYAKSCLKSNFKITNILVLEKFSRLWKFMDIAVTFLKFLMEAY